MWATSHLGTKANRIHLQSLWHFPFPRLFRHPWILKKKATILPHPQVETPRCWHLHQASLQLQIHYSQDKQSFHCFSQIIRRQSIASRWWICLEEELLTSRIEARGHARAVGRIHSQFQAQSLYSPGEATYTELKYLSSTLNNRSFRPSLKVILLAEEVFLCWRRRHPPLSSNQAQGRVTQDTSHSQIGLFLHKLWEFILRSDPWRSQWNKTCATHLIPQPWAPWLSLG